MKPSGAFHIGYQPLQMYPHSVDGKISYREVIPALALQPYVFCYWELKTVAPLEEGFHYQVVADGCMDFFMALDQPRHKFLMGYSRSHSRFSLGTSFHYLGVRFLPLALPMIFRLNAHELKEQVLPLTEVLPKIARLADAVIHPTTSLEQLKGHFDRAIGQYIEASDFNPDPRVLNAVAQIYATRGALPIEQLDTGLGARQMRRLFREYLGGSAKSLAMIVRFQNAMRFLAQAPDYGFKYLKQDLGYTDQAHFCREFKAFAGASPQKLKTNP